MTYAEIAVVGTAETKPVKGSAANSGTCTTGCIHIPGEA